MLEQMVAAVKAKMKPKLPEDSFLVPAWEDVDQLDHNLQTLGQGTVEQTRPSTLHSYYEQQQ